LGLVVVADLDSLRDWILHSLGAPVLNIELHEDQVDDAIGDALTWFSDIAGIESYHQFNILDGVSEYHLPTVLGLPTEPPAIQAVLDLIFEAPDSILRDDFGFFYGIPFFGGMLSSGSGPRVRGQIFAYSSMLQWLQYIETAKRMLSAERSWEYDKFSGILRITPIPNLTIRGIVLLKRKLPIADFGKLTERFRDLIKKRSLMGAMYRLARIRGKYDSVPGAGRDFSLNAEPLKVEADEIKEDTDTRISQIVEFINSPWVIG